MNLYSISIYLDSRRVKRNGKFPLKLRVYTSNPRKQKIYPTVFDFTKEEFDKIWISLKPRGEYKKHRAKLQALELHANTVAEGLKPFTFQSFEKKLYRKVDDGVSVSYQYNEVIQELINRKQLSTASTYKLSLKSIENFIDFQFKKSIESLTLYDITDDWLKDYEKYMVEEKKRSLTTVSIYLRVLRAIYNKAIDEGEIEKEFYPFGKRKYVVPSKRNVKKALSKDQLHILFNAKPANPQQKKARDFWFLSYACNGINIKDIALLKYKDIKDGKIEFLRAKTINTSKGNLKAVEVYLNDFSKDVINRYGNSKTNGETLVFNIIQPGMKPVEEQTKIKNFTRFINQHIKNLAKNNGLSENISTYWARHSFATNAIRNGASMEFVSEGLGHNNLKTTQAYFSGFEEKEKKKISEKLMDF